MKDLNVYPNKSRLQKLIYSALRRCDNEKCFYNVWQCCIVVIRVKKECLLSMLYHSANKKDVERTIETVVILGWQRVKTRASVLQGSICLSFFGKGGFLPPSSSVSIRHFVDFFLLSHLRNQTKSRNECTRSMLCYAVVSLIGRVRSFDRLIS